MDFLKQVGKMIEEEAAKAQAQMADQQRLLDETQRSMEARKKTQRSRGQIQQRRAPVPVQPAPATIDQMEQIALSRAASAAALKPGLKIGFSRKDIIKGLIIAEVLEPRWKKSKAK